MTASELIEQLVSAVENRGDFQVLTEYIEDGWPRTHNVKRVDVEEIEGNHFIMIKV